MYKDMAIMQAVKKTYYFLKRNGLRKTISAVRERLDKKGKVSYQYAYPEVEEVKRQRALFEGVEAENYPRFSIVVPLYETKESFLRELLDSVKAQTYPFWELLLGDFSTSDTLKQVCDSYGDERFVYRYFGNNQGISENTNQVLTMVTGAYVGLLDHDDVLTEDALFEVYEAIKKEEKKGLVPKLIYSDEDKWTGEKGDYYSLHSKEPFNYELLFSYNYVCHFSVMETELIKGLGFRTEYTGSQDYDLVLRAVDEIKKHENWTIGYVDRVLYHWRCHPGSSAENPVSKTYAYEAGKKALEDLFQKKGWDISVKHRQYVGLYELVYGKPYFEVRPEVGILGGRVLYKGAISGGRLSEEGDVYYEGIPKDYTGYFHKAILPQDAYAVDVRSMKLNPACKDVFMQITGQEYHETDQGVCANFLNLTKEDAKSVSLSLCEAIRALGYQVVWNPDQVADVEV